MPFWTQLAKGIFKIKGDSGNTVNNRVFGGQELLDQTATMVRTITSGGRIIKRDPKTGNEIK